MMRRLAIALLFGGAAGASDDCRQARFACAPGFACVQCPDGAWECSPASDPGGASVCGPGLVPAPAIAPGVGIAPGAGIAPGVGIAPAASEAGPAADAPPAPARKRPRDVVVAAQNGRRVCARGWRGPIEVMIDAHGPRIAAMCHAGAANVRLEGDPAETPTLRCLGIDTSRPCPQTVLADGGRRETQIGEVTGEARLVDGRLVGHCACVLPRSGGVPGRRVEARFDVAWPPR